MVSLVTIHHEGAGTPSDVTRGADGGYSIWIGAARYTMLRPPAVSFATLNFNHVSLDICLSGNRMTSPVTDGDITQIRNAVTEARGNGWVIDAPQVRAHRNSPGSSTVCPGDNAMARWGDIVAACTKSTPRPPPPPVVKVRADYVPALQLPPIVSSMKAPGGSWLLGDDGGVFAFPNDGTVPFHGSPHGTNQQIPAGETWSKIRSPNRKDSKDPKTRSDGKPVSYVCVTSGDHRYGY